MPEMRITFLGTGAGNCIYRSHTAICLDCPDGTRLLLDAASGNSVTRNGAQLGLLARDYHHVLLSHQHGDHMGGIPHLEGLRTMTNPEAGPLQVYSSEPTLRKLEALFRATSVTHSIDQDGVDTAQGKPVVRWTPVEDSQHVVISPEVRAWAFPVDHIPGALGWAVVASGITLVFSGDTRFCPRVAQAAQGADVLIHEVLSTDADREGARSRGHTTAAEAAQIAAEAGVRRLVMTHLDSPFHLDQRPLIDEARFIYDGPIAAANDLSQFTVSCP